MSITAVDDRQLSRLTDSIQQKIGNQRYQVWFHNSTKFDFKQDILEVAVPNDFIGEWIGTHFVRSIQEAAVDVLGCNPQVKFTVDPLRFIAGHQDQSGQNNSNGTTKAAIARPVQAERYVAEVGKRPFDFMSKTAAIADMPRKAVHREIPGMSSSPTSNNKHIAADPLQPHAPMAPANGKARLRHDLESYVVGQSNQLAYNAAVYVAEYPGGQYNPLFVHGNCGLGKSHLLQGLCKRFAELHPTKKWMYVTGEEFTNEFLYALRNNRVDAFRRKMRDLDFLCIDDVHFLSGKKATQEEFLHTFNAIEAMGKQVVMASDAHPKMIEEFGESLINRFVSGMVVRIDAPNFNTRCEILRNMSLRNRVNLSEEVIHWVAKRVTQNVRELEGAITRMSAHTRLTGRPADITLAQEALGDLDRQLAAPVKPENVLTSVCDYFGLEMRELMSGRRQRTISLARSVAMFLVRKTSKLSFPEIAVKMGKRNHSTVISACRRIERAAGKNELLAWTSHVGEREEEAGELIQRLEEQARSFA